MIAVAAHVAGGLGRRSFVRRAGAAALSAAIVGCGVQLPHAQQGTRTPRIGYLSLGDSDAPLSEAFRQGLRELGYVEGQNIAIEYRYLPDTWTQDQLQGMLADLISLPVDVLVIRGAPPTLAAKKATSTIPIVGPIMRDPVGDGLVASLAQPGSNVTGITNFATDLYGKHLELLRAVVPTLSRVGVLFDRNDQSAANSYAVVEAAAAQLGIEPRSLGVRAPDELPSAFEVATGEHVDALMTLGSSMIVNQQARIVELAERHRLPAIYGIREAARAGGLMAYGADIRDQFRRAAIYVDKILRGAKPADLPVERPTKFDLVINLKTAATLGLTVPRSLLLEATELVQ